MNLPAVFVLVGTRSPGNVGAVCRAAAAFGVSAVRLVRPACDPGHEEARWLAHGAEDLLHAITVHDRLADALAGCSHTVATTARSRNWRRPVITPATAAATLADATHERPFALVFGPEDRGLTNEDLSQCDAVVSIPLPRGSTATLSLPAAATILAWELALGDHVMESPAPDTAGLRRTLPPGQEAGAERTLGTAELDELLEDIHHTLAGIGFRAKPDAARFRGSLRDFLARARPTEGDRRLLRHLFAQVGKWRRRIRGEAKRGLLS